MMGFNNFPECFAIIYLTFPRYRAGRKRRSCAKMPPKYVGLLLVRTFTADIYEGFQENGLFCM